MDNILNLVDEYALGVFRGLSDDSLIEKHKFFTNLASLQTENNDPTSAKGTKAMADLVMRVMRERNLFYVELTKPKEV